MIAGAGTGLTAKLRLASGKTAIDPVFPGLAYNAGSQGEMTIMVTSSRLLHLLLALILGLCMVGLARADIPPPNGQEPTIIHTYLHLEDINDIDLSTGTYDITALFAMRWKDPRLAFSRPDGNDKPEVWMGNRAKTHLDSIWHPILDVSGEKGLTANAVHSLTIAPDGTAVLRQKFSGSPRFTGELIHFPFGRLSLDLTISSVAMTDDQVRFSLEHLSPNNDMRALDKVLHGNWTPIGIAWNTTSKARPSSPDQQYPQIDLQILVEHDFVDGVHKILLPLIVIAFASWGLLWVDLMRQTSYASPRIGGMVTLILTTIALKFMMGRELPVVHYLTLSDVLFNATIIMLSMALLASCAVAALFTEFSAVTARRFNIALRRVYPLLYVLVILIGYGFVLDEAAEGVHRTAVLVPADE